MYSSPQALSGSSGLALLRDKHRRPAAGAFGKMANLGVFRATDVTCCCCHYAGSTGLRSRTQATSTSLRSSFLGAEGSCNILSSSQRLKPQSSGQSKRRVTAMAAKVTGYIKLALEAGKANPAPPVGPALGSKGVNIMSFCKEYNAATQDKVGQVIPVEITVFEDRSFTFILKTPPASFLLKRAAKISKGAGEPNTQKAGEITQEQLREIAQTKLPDLNCTKIESAMKVIAGTARNMGIKIREEVAS